MILRNEAGIVVNCGTPFLFEANCQKIENQNISFYRLVSIASSLLQSTAMLSMCDIAAKAVRLSTN